MTSAEADASDAGNFELDNGDDEEYHELDDDDDIDRLDEPDVPSLSESTDTLPQSEPSRSISEDRPLELSDSGGRSPSDSKAVGASSVRSSSSASAAADVPSGLASILSKDRPVRFFIMKSFSAEHLKKAVDENIWATQAHNEAKLAAAFERAEVVLIFSVNNSRHFQGYARMVSKPGRRAEWSEGKRDAWGGAFKIDWIRVYDLPFEQTSHLHNPLNENKPVKISRDGQELTSDVGRALCTLFDIGAAQNPKKRKLESTENLPPPLPKRPGSYPGPYRDSRFMPYPPPGYRPPSPPRRPPYAPYASRPRTPPRHRSPSPPSYRSSSSSSRYSPPRSSSAYSSASRSSRDYDYRFAPPGSLPSSYGSFMPPTSSIREYSPPPRSRTPPRSSNGSVSSSSRSSSSSSSSASRSASSSSRSGSGSAPTAAYDLINMTYEEYIASHAAALSHSALEASSAAYYATAAPALYTNPYMYSAFGLPQ